MSQPPMDSLQVIAGPVDAPVFCPGYYANPHLLGQLGILNH